MNNYNPDQRKQKSLAVWGFIALLSALLLSQLAADYIANIFVGLVGALMPILLGIVLAYLLKKLLFWLEEKAFSKMFKNTKKPKTYRRILALSLMFSVLIGVITFIIMTVLPEIVNIASDLSSNSEQYINNITLQLTEFAAKFEFLNNADVKDSIAEGINNLAANIESYLPVILDKAVQIAGDTTIIILNIALSFILAFLMLKDKEKISTFFKRSVYVNFKTYRADNIIKTARKSDVILYSYFIGKLIEAGIIFTIVGIGLFILSTPYAFVLAGIIAILNFIPYVGAIIGLVPIALLTIIFGTVTTAIWAVIYSLVVIILITSFVSPVIFGKQLKVSALLIILSIIIGGGMFGILGMLFAPPVVAIIAVLITENIKQKEEMKLVAKSHGLTEEDLMDESLLIEAGKIVREKRKIKE